MPDQTPIDLHDGARIRAVVKAAADEAYTARVDVAVRQLMGKTGVENYGTIKTELMEKAGLEHDEFVALHGTVSGHTPRNFQAFARVLGVSARWLAIGGPWPQEPPAGWSTFGTHLDGPSELEFSLTLDPGDLMPLWERPRAEVGA